MVWDINPNAGNSNPQLSVICNSKVMFTATDGDVPNVTDLYTVNGTFTALPIKISDFTVSLKNQDALLKWTTLQEENARDFTIQRSFDAQHFEDIGIIQATGTSSNRHDYTFTDAGIVNSGKSIVYYRLAASDIDGKTENTNVISLKISGNSQWNVRLLSNPVQDYVTVLLSGVSGNVQMSIRDINGKIIYTNTFQNINGQISLPANLSHGIFVLIAETNNERKTIKFIK